jgi:hypothetical protein
MLAGTDLTDRLSVRPGRNNPGMQMVDQGEI